MIVFNGSDSFIFVGNHVAIGIINIIIAGNIAIFKSLIVITGIYEIDTAAKIADALKVTLDFLVKDAEYQNIDNDALKRLKLLEKLSPEDKNHIFALMDAFFAKHKLKNLLQ